jgi:hypothetical protein
MSKRGNKNSHTENNGGNESVNNEEQITNEENKEITETKHSEQAHTNGYTFKDLANLKSVMDKVEELPLEERRISKKSEMLEYLKESIRAMQVKGYSNAEIASYINERQTLYVINKRDITILLKDNIEEQPKPEKRRGRRKKQAEPIANSSDEETNDTRSDEA